MRLKNEQGAVLVITVLILVIISVIGTAALRTTNTELLVARNEKINNKAFYLAEAGIEHAKAKIYNYQYEGFNSTDLGGNYIRKIGDFNNTISFNDTLSNGTYIVSVNSTIYDGEFFNSTNSTILSKGIMGNAQKSIKVGYSFKDYRIDVDVDAAFSIYTDEPNIDVKGAGTVISGEDYNWPDQFYCSGSNCGSDVNGSVSKENAIYSQNDLTLETSGNPEIYPSYDDSTEGNGKYDNNYWMNFVNELISLADNVSYSDSIDSSDLGTREHPEITYVQSNSTLSAGTEDGAGILIIDSPDVQFSGNFHFEGQVIILNENYTSISLKASGTPYIYGNLVVAGNGNSTIEIQEEYDFTGTPNIRYSYQALRNVNNADKLTDPKVLYWKEIN